MPDMPMVFGDVKGIPVEVAVKFNTLLFADITFKKFLCGLLQIVINMSIGNNLYRECKLSTYQWRKVVWIKRFTFLTM